MGRLFCGVAGGRQEGRERWRERRQYECFGVECGLDYEVESEVDNVADGVVDTGQWAARLGGWRVGQGEKRQKMWWEGQGSDLAVQLDWGAAAEHKAF